MCRIMQVLLYSCKYEYVHGNPCERKQNLFLHCVLYPIWFGTLMTVSPTIWFACTIYVIYFMYYEHERASLARDMWIAYTSCPHWPFGP